MKIRKISNRILAYTLTLAILLSSLVFGAVSVTAEETEIDVWDGTTAESFAGGDGSAATPYLIETAEQLRLLVTSYCSADYETGNFKLTKDIYLNNVVDGTHVKSLADKKNWAEGLAEGTTANSFYGTLDGDGHTIYGLYAFGESAALGLLPAINNATVIKNLNFDNLYINGADSSGAAIAGAAKYYTWQKTAQISYCSVTNAVIGQGGNMEFAAGLVADAQDAKVNFSNCYVKDSTFSDWSTGAGIIANDWGKGITLNNCYTADIYPVRSSVASATATNVYTNVAAPEGNVTANIVTLTDDQMKGDAAKENMAGFDFVGTWQTVEGSYPVIRDEIIGVWDGTKDYNLEGSGTEADPYLVKTAAHLAAITSGNNGGAFTGKYFKLANDIRINDTTSANWKDSARGWGWANFRFTGTFDGDGHTIDGLYYKGSQRVMGLFSYVGIDDNGLYKTTLKNFNMTNAYIESTGADGAGFVAGQASRVTYFDGVYIDDTCEINATTKGVGGILGQSSYNVFMSNIAMNGKVVGGSNVGAFAGTLSSGARLDIKSSYTTADLYAQGVTDRNLATTSSAVYVVKKEGTIDAVATLLTADQMKGAAAKTYMTGLSFELLWETAENDYPVYNPRVEIWDGSVSTALKGSGTAEDPHLIENGADLRYMVESNNVSTSVAATEYKYYKLTKDIYLNVVSSDNLLDAKNADLNAQGFNGWYTGSNSAGFFGELDGAGHTVYGLFYENTTTNKTVGLIPTVVGGTIKNINLKNSSIGANWAAGGIVGYKLGATQPLFVKGCSVENTCIVTTTSVRCGGIVGGAGTTNTVINISECAVVNSTIKCYSSSYPDIQSSILGYIGDKTGTYTVTNCFTANAGHPVTHTANTTNFAKYTSFITYTNVYTDTTHELTANGVSLLTADQMQGENAKTYMTGFDFANIWQTVEGDFPVIKENPVYPWDGSAATSLKGDGTKANPYKISNGAELYYAISTYSAQANNTLAENIPYFEITSDINLANQQWYNVGKTSYPSAANFSTGFAGIIYGNGHTIYNLSNAASVSIAGLIPVATQGTEIYDLHLVNGNLPKVVWNTYTGGGLIGLAVGTASSTPIVIDGCSVENYTVDSRDASSAFVGMSYSQSLIIKDCYAVGNTISHTSAVATMNSGAFIGIHSDGNNEGNSFLIQNCYTDGDADIGYVRELTTTFKNVYTTLDTYDNSVNGLSKVTAAQLTGSAAKNNLNGFNFNQKWQAVDAAYPVHTTMDYRAQYFTGNAASTFAGGTGSEADPYLISTADQLYLLANLDRETTLGKFYKLTNNISISNVYSGWANDDPYTWAVKKAYLDGFTYASSFAGTLDGAGYTVSGLYYNNAIVDGGAYAYGVIPFATANAVIKNITVSDVNAVVSGNAYVGAVVGAAHVMAEDIAASDLNAVQFVGVNANNITIGATNKGDILGGASRGVKFELCEAATLYGNVQSDVLVKNCQNGAPYRAGIVIYNALNINEAALANVRNVLIGKAGNLYIAALDLSTADFDICDLVAAKNALANAEPEEKLVWSQEFGGSQLDKSVWSTNTTMGVGTTLEYANTATFDGSTMALNCYDTGRIDANGNTIYSITNGLSTKDTMSFKYGRLEMRAKVPFGAGAFPSLWLTSRNALGNGISPYGYDNEVDIFEVFGSKTGVDTMVTCIHKWYTDENGVRTGDECSCGSGILAGNGYKVEQADRDYQITGAAQDEFHTIVFEWTEDTMTFAVDGNLYYTAKRSDMDNFDISGYDTNSDAIFNQFMYLRLNNHMYTVGDGAAYSYQGNASEIDPAKLTYEIDYIRLYQTDNGEINLK